MEREFEKKVEELRNNGIDVYSFSRLECINNCLYEAYRTYVLDERDKQIPNIYGVLGGRIHDVLEGIMNKTNTEKDLISAMNQELDDLDMLGIEFPKGRDGSDSIRQSWIQNMTHFCNSYKAPHGKFETETFFLYQTPNNHYVQGYIDLTRIRKDGSIDIYDYKTSSMYRGEEIKKHGRQLVLYALGKEQQGYKVNTIAWIFLKYCKVIYTAKKRTNSKEESEITKIIERKNLVNDLADVIEGKLQKYKIDEVDIEIIMNEARERNIIPEILQCEFKVLPYVMEYKLTDEIREECNQYLDNTIEMWESIDKTNENNYQPLSFTKTNKNGEIKENTFYCNSLCGYSKKCFYLKKYYDTKQNQKKEEDLW